MTIGNRPRCTGDAKIQSSGAESRVVCCHCFSTSSRPLPAAICFRDPAVSTASTCWRTMPRLTLSLPLSQFTSDQRSAKHSLIRVLPRQQAAAPCATQARKVPASARSTRQPVSRRWRRAARLGHCRNAMSPRLWILIPFQASGKERCVDVYILELLLILGKSGDSPISRRGRGAVPPQSPRAPVLTFERMESLCRFEI
jgi:hypothetical protein